jgi:ABC-type nitrate/sulfonate/bicarbonate transport system permease component
VLLALLLFLWQEASVHGLVNQFLVPSVVDILGAGGFALRDHSLLDALEGTLTRFIVGFTLATMIGVVLGALLGYSRTMYALLEPTVELLRPLPPPAIVPLLILLLGFENRMKITAVVIAASFPIIVNTMHGVRSVDPVLMDTARTFGHRGLAVICRVVLPAASPAILAGMRISLAVSLIVTVVAEMIAGGNGMGYFILESQRSFDTHRMYAGIFALALLGYILNWTFVSIERFALPWYADRIQR